MNKYTPNTSEEFRRVQYVSVSDPALGRLQGKPTDYTIQAGGQQVVYPVRSWEVDQQNRLLAVEIMIEGARRFGEAPVTKWLKVSQVNLFMSSDRQVLKVLRGQE